jgi:hypothetical protein
MFPPICFRAMPRAEFILPFARTLVRSLLPIRTVVEGHEGRAAVPGFGFAYMPIEEWRQDTARTDLLGVLSGVLQ